MTTLTVDRLIHVVGLLPAEKVSEVLDFAQFLLWRSQNGSDDKKEYYLWAEDLAKRQGFAHLREEDVAYIVHQARQSNP